MSSVDARVHCYSSLCPVRKFSALQDSGNSSDNNGDSESVSLSDEDYVQPASGLDPDGPTPGRGHPRPGRAASASGRHGSGALNGLATEASVDALSVELCAVAGMLPAMGGQPSPPLPLVAPQAKASSFAVNGGNRFVAARGQARATVVSQKRVGNGRGKKPHMKAGSSRNGSDAVLMVSLASCGKVDAAGKLIV